MKVAGFTIVRNILKFQYPAKEAILSILPLCDEFIVAVGKSDDATLEFISGIDSDKITIIHSIWDDSLREGGRTLAVETNKAFQTISADFDWVFYIQADEILHEKFFPVVREAMLKYKDDLTVDGLLFNYRHFYGSYDYLGEASKWYRKEIRIIRNSKNIFSYKDAQGFRKKPNQKLKVKQIEAEIYHYGWVREPQAMQQKRKAFNRFYFNDKLISGDTDNAEEFDYSGIDALVKFSGSHPSVMSERIANKNWKFDHDVSKKNFRLKDKIKRIVESLTGWRIGEYKNYKII